MFKYIKSRPKKLSEILNLLQIPQPIICSIFKELSGVRLNADTFNTTVCNDNYILYLVIVYFVLKYLLFRKIHKIVHGCANSFTRC